MKKTYFISFTLFVLCLFAKTTTAWGQNQGLFNKGACIVISERSINSGADTTSLYIKGKYVSKNEGQITNGGKIYVTGDFIDSTAVWPLDLNNEQTRLFTTINGWVVFNGKNNQNIDSNDPNTLINFHNIRLNKLPATKVLLLDSIWVADTLALNSGSVDLNWKRIKLGGVRGKQHYGELLFERDNHRVFGEGGSIYTERLAWPAKSATTGIDPDFNRNILGFGLQLECIDIPFSYVRISRLPNQQDAGDSSFLRTYQFDTEDVVPMARTRINYLGTEQAGIPEGNLALWTKRSEIWRRMPTIEDAIQNYVVTDSDTITFGPTPNAAYTQRITVAPADCSEENKPKIFLENHPQAINVDTIAKCEGQASVVLDAGNPNMEYFWVYWQAKANPQTDPVDKSLGTKQIQTAAVEGHYAVEVTNNDGCIAWDTIFVEFNPAPEIAISYTNDLCYGTQVSFANETKFSDGTSPTDGQITYFWDFGDTRIVSDTSSSDEPQYAYEYPGAYQVEVIATSYRSCLDTLYETVRIHPIPEPDFKVNQNVCEGLEIVFSDASTIIQLPAFPTGIDSVYWDFDPNETTDNVGEKWTQGMQMKYTYTNVGEVDVTLKAISNNGCEKSITRTIRVNPKPQASFAIAEACDNEAITYTNTSVVSTGSIQQYSWDLGNGTNTNLQNPVEVYDSAGIYTVKLIVTSDFGCQDSINQNATVHAIPVPSFDFISHCADSLIHFDNQSALAFGTLSHNWSLGDGNSSNSADVNHAYVNSGSYQVTLTSTSDFGCQQSVTRAVEVYPNPSANFVVNDVCKGSQSEFVNTSSISQGNLNYVWSLTPAVSSSEQNPVYIYPTANDFNISLTAISDNGCSHTFAGVATVHPLPIIDLGTSPINTCASSYTIDAENAGSTFLWTTNETSQQITITADGDYGVDVTSPQGCMNTANIYINVDTPVVIGLPAAIVACDSVTLDSGIPGANSYAWSTGSTDRDIVVNASGIYTIDLLDQNDCPATTSVDVTIKPSPVVSLADAAICEGALHRFDASTTNATYEWFDRSTAPTLQTNTSGNYWVAVTVDGCTTYDTAQLTVNPLPVLNLGRDTTVCDEILLDAMNAGSAYLWNTGANTQTLLVTNTGEYIVEVTNAKGCINQDTINIAVNSSPSVDLGNDQTVCNGETAILDAGNAGMTFLWSTNTTDQTFAVASTGTYSVAVTDPANSCIGRDTINIVVAPPVNINLGSDIEWCGNDSLRFDAGNTGGSFLWSSNIKPDFSTSQTLLVGNAGVYWVQVTNVFGCTSADTVEVLATTDTVTAGFLAKSTVNTGDSIQFVQTSFPTKNITGWEWNFGDGTPSSSKEDPTHTFFRSGSYKVRLAVTSNTCVDTLFKNIDVKQLRIIPTNSDSLNYTEIFDYVLYPNPTDGPFSIELSLSQEAQIELWVVDIKGRVLEKRRVQGQELREGFDMSQSPTGMYLLRIAVGNQLRVLRFVKK